MNIKLNPEKFRPLPARTDDPGIILPSPGFRQQTWKRLQQNRLAMIGLYTLLLFALFAVIGPELSKYGYSEQFLDKQGLPPCREFWFGTDTLGRDIFTRILYGARISMSVGIFSSLINLILGVVYGGISGYAGGWVDNLMMRVVDVLYSVPPVLYAILLLVVLESGFLSAFLALGLVYWLDMARIVRACVLSLKEQDFVLAARMTGAKPGRILFRHILPNCLGPIVLTLFMSVPRAIITESFLSFIGLGVSAPMASWGTMTAEALQSIRSYPHILFFPASLLSILVLSFNLLGEGLNAALDPRLRNLGGTYE